MDIKFGEFLKQKRQEKKLTQKELAKLLFVSESAVSKWEKNAAHPDITLLPKLSEILGVTEHELITASVDNKSRTEKIEAKKWRTFSFSWSLFFYISYAVALIPCFICDLAINKSLTWFWIVLSALLLAFTFTNLPKHIKKHKLILIPASMFIALCILLGVCCIYTKGDWFLTTVLGVLIGYVAVFYPIVFYKTKLGLSKEKFSKLKKWFLLTYAFSMIILTLLLLVIINCSRPFNLFNGIMITLYSYTILAGFGLIGLIKTNAYTKIGLGFLSMVLYLFGLEKVLGTLLGTNVEGKYHDIDFSNWSTHIDANITFIVELSLLGLSILFLTLGLILHYKRKNSKIKKN